MTRRTKVGPATLTLLGTLAWLAIHWPHVSLWYDETLTAWVAGGTWSNLFQWCTAVDIQVPLHYIVLKIWMGLAGNSEFTLHLLSAFCGLLSIAGLMALARRLVSAEKGHYVGTAAGILLALSPGFLWIAYEVRAYALALALYIWASVMLFILLNSEKPRIEVLLAYSGLMIGAIYTHYTALGGLAAHAAIIVLTVLFRRSPEERWQIVRRMGLAGTIILAGFLPWLPILLSRSTADRSYYPGSYILPDRTLGVILSFLWMARDDFPQAFAVPIWTGAGLIAVGVLLWMLSRRDARRWQPILYGLCMTILPIALIAIVVYFKPKLAGRYAWAAWIGLDTLIALGLAALLRGRGRLILIAAVIIGAIPWLPGLSDQIGHPPDSDFRGAFAYIRDHWHDGDLVILRDGALFTAADHYQSPMPFIGLPETKITDVTHILHTAEALSILPKQADSIRGVWIVSWQGYVMDPEFVTAGMLESIGAEEAINTSFGDVGVEYYRLTRPLSDLPAAIQMPAPNADPLYAIPNGPQLIVLRLATPGSLHPGDRIIGHGWWQRHDPINSNARVSIRLYGPDGRVYGQKDQPPAGEQSPIGWSYFPDHWPADTLILGRYEMLIPPDAPSSLTMKIVVYSAANDAAPAEFEVGTVQVVPK